MAPVPARKRRAALALSSAPVPPEAMAPGVSFQPALPPAAGSGGAPLPCLSSALSVIGRLRCAPLSPSPTSADRLTILLGLPLLIGQFISLLRGKTISTQAPWCIGCSWHAAGLNIMGLYGQ